MLKNILCLLVCIVIAGGTAQAQGVLAVTPTDTLSLDTTVSAQAESAMILTLHNNSVSDSVLKWRVVYNTFPHGWTFGFCDPNVCYSPILTGSIHYTLAAGHTGLMQLDLTPSSGTATGAFQILTWDPADSAGSAVYLTYKAHIATFATGITEAEAAQISFYPNPVRSQLKITLPQGLDNGQIDIFNLLGSKVYSQPITARETVKGFDLSSLETGLYVARISDGGKIIATRKFTKED